MVDSCCSIAAGAVVLGASSLVWSVDALLQLQPAGPCRHEEGSLSNGLDPSGNCL